MCKVRGITFSCGHFAKIRLSACGGTYRKARRTGESVACCADAYFWVKLSADCVQCQMGQVEASKQRRLERAIFFLSRMRVQLKSGVGEVQTLVNDLQQKHEQEIWAISKTCVSTSKSHLRKVKILNQRNKGRQVSLLQKEVRPEDSLQENNMNNEPSIAKSLEADGSNALMDYSHPWNQVDGCDGIDTNLFQIWDMDENTTQEDVVTDFAVDTWQSDLEGWDQSFPMQAYNAKRSCHILNGDTTQEMIPQAAGLIARGPSASVLPFGGTVGFEGLEAPISDPSKRISETIDQFWSFVNEGPVTEKLQSRAVPRKTSPSHSRDIHPPPQDQDQEHRRTLTHPFWPDGSCESLIFPRSSTSSSRIGSDGVQRCTGQLKKYNKMRSQLLAGSLKRTDPRNFYSKWLAICRWEAQDTEDCRGHGRNISCP